jgi:hypothetical protein
METTTVTAGKFCKEQDKDVCKTISACKWIQTAKSRYCKSNRKTEKIAVVQPARTARTGHYAVRQGRASGETKAVPFHVLNSGDIPESDSDRYSDSDSDDGLAVRRARNVIRLLRPKPKRREQAIFYVQGQGEEKASAPNPAPTQAVAVAKASAPNPVPAGAVVTTADMTAVHAASAKAAVNAHYHAAVIQLNNDKFYFVPIKITNVGTVKVSTVLEKLNKKINHFVGTLQSGAVAVPVTALICVKYGTWAIEKPKDVFESNTPFFFAARDTSDTNLIQLVSFINADMSLIEQGTLKIASVFGFPDSIKSVADKMKTLTTLSADNLAVQNYYSAPLEAFFKKE